MDRALRSRVRDPLLWHFPISHYSEKVRWALDWKRIPHRRVVLSASYLPRAWWATGRGTLPVLHLEGQAIGDSTRIIAALEDHTPQPPLYPAQRAFRAAHPLFRRYYYWRHRIGDATRSAAPEAVRSGFDRIEAELGSREYLVGAGFSVADLSAAAILAPLVRPPGSLWARLGELPEPVGRFVASLEQRPAFAWVHEMYRRHRGASAELRG